MFTGVSLRWSRPPGSLSTVRKFTSSLAHLKSEPSRQADEFPYKHLNQRDVSHMSAEMESTARLPLRSFFAQHRPLMPFAKPMLPDRMDISEDSETRWVHVPVNHGRFPILASDERAMWSILPEHVARQLGPFNREALMSSRLQGLRYGNKGDFDKVPASSEPEILSATEMQAVLSKRFPILMEHLQKITGNNGQLKVIPLTVEKMDAPEEGVEATSVRRKRKLKMNRHKYRKRLKEQRTKRRRLGK